MVLKITEAKDKKPAPQSVGIKLPRVEPIAIQSQMSAVWFMGMVTRTCRLCSTTSMILPAGMTG